MFNNNNKKGGGGGKKPTQKQLIENKGKIIPPKIEREKKKKKGKRKHAYQVGLRSLSLHPTGQQQLPLTSLTSLTPLTFLTLLTVGTMVVEDTVVVSGGAGGLEEAERVADTASSVPAQPVALVAVADPVRSQLVAGLERVLLERVLLERVQLAVRRVRQEQPNTDDAQESRHYVCGPRREHAWQAHAGVTIIMIIIMMMLI